MQRLNTPVLITVFNRPDRARKVFAVVKKVRPKMLFINADGPRKNKPEEDALCRETRAVFNNIDWDCKVFKKFNSKNLGVKNGMVSAIDWFFEHVDRGIILEDDCLPEVSFFRFCEELLKKYKDN